MAHDRTIMFNNKTILVTGASGFIGGRIIERLCLQTNARVKALVHDVNHAPRIARFPIEIIRGDVLDKNLLTHEIKGVDYVIHCAVGNTPNQQINHKITIQGTRNIVQASFQNNVDRLIYFSTVSVYGYPLPKKCNEKTPYNWVSGDYYNNDKIDAEKIVTSYIKKGLQATILQPTVVYGPYGHGWTRYIVDKIRDKNLFLVNNGNGLANPLYIDNLVDAVFLALTKSAAIGERFIISDGIAIPWKQFYSYFYTFVTGKPISKYIKSHTFITILLAKIVRPLKKIKNILIPFQLFPSSEHPIKKTLDQIIDESTNIRAFFSNANAQASFNDMCTFEIRKAKKLLGYLPTVGLERGMKLTIQWLKHNQI